MTSSVLQKTHKASCRFFEEISRFLPVPRDTIRVHHGADPWSIGGPNVKIQRMHKYFPEHSVRFNIIYTVSNRVSSAVCIKAKQRRIKIVQHINSVYDAIYRQNYTELNKPLNEIYKIADHIVFGSNYAKERTEYYFGKCNSSYSVIYNSVDLNHFTPQKKPDNRFNILAIGGHYIRHRIEPLIRAMPFVTKEFPKAMLIIAGQLHKGEGIFNCSKESFETLARDHNVTNIEFLPQYTQAMAPDIINLGDIVVHLKHMDWTPNTVIESMACGLPTLHSGNGGLPEIAGESGLSLDLPNDWNEMHSPDPQLLAEKIIELYEIRHEKGNIARDIAEKHYDLKAWVSEHQQIFEGLLNSHA